MNPGHAPYGTSDARYGDYPMGSSEPKLGAYAPGSRWMEPGPPRSNRRKWIVIGSIAALVGLIVIGVVVGVVVSNSHKKSNTLAVSSGSGNATVSTSSTVQQTDPNDPSSFTKDSNLHQSLYGIAYTPVGSQLPDCGNSLRAFFSFVSELRFSVSLFCTSANL